MSDPPIHTEGLPPERRSLLPGAGFFIPDELDRERREAEIAEALAGRDVVVIADPDADGLACAALVREVHADAALVPTGPHDIPRGLRRVAEHAAAATEVYVCDLCPDEPDGVLDALEPLRDRDVTVHWFDHHQWDDATAAALRDAGVDLAVGDADEECSADVALRALGDAVPARFDDLVAATRDHDLWIRDDPRSDDLADYAHWAEPDEYVEAVRTHGADLPAAARELLEERRVEKRDFIDRAVGRAVMRSIGDVTVGVTYGRCSQNEVAEALRERGADVAVIVKPAGSASLRGTDAFARCHEVAARVNGGGHPKAAGCKPEIYDDMLDYAHHWTTQGAVAKRVILDAVREVIESAPG